MNTIIPFEPIAFVGGLVFGVVLCAIGIDLIVKIKKRFFDEKTKV